MPFGACMWRWLLGCVELSSLLKIFGFLDVVFHANGLSSTPLKK